MLEKLKKGTEIDIGEIKAVVSSDFMKFKDTIAIYADIINPNCDSTCFVKKIEENGNMVAIILRNKSKMLKMGLESSERKAIYCHELGHCFSKNQILSEDRQRLIENEVDADTFAVEECDILPEILESALRKSYDYEISMVKDKKDLTKERVTRFVEEMKARKRNVERLIKKKNKNDIAI